MPEEDEVRELAEDFERLSAENRMKGDEVAALIYQDAANHVRYKFDLDESGE